MIATLVLNKDDKSRTLADCIRKNTPDKRLQEILMYSEDDINGYVIDFTIEDVNDQEYIKENFPELLI